MTLLQLIAHLKDVFENEGNMPVRFLNPRSSQWEDLNEGHILLNSHNGEDFLELDT